MPSRAISRKKINSKSGTNKNEATNSNINPILMNIGFICAALVAAFRDIVTRKISTTEKSSAILFYSTLALTLIGLATFPFGWKPMTFNDIGIAILAGTFFGLGHYFIIEGYRYAEASIIAPYRYLNLIWAVILGYILWKEIPSAWVLLGTPLVVGSGLYILYDEGKKSRAR